MGSFRGHALPGTFFITMGIWWTIKCTLKYACKKHKRTSYLGSKALFHRMDIVEGITIICMALTEFHCSFSFVKGIMFSFSFVFLHALFMALGLCYGHQIIEQPFPTGRIAMPNSIGMLGEQFVAEGPHLALYNYKEGQWVQLLSWHHSTMYFFFGLVGVANILRFIINSFPISLIKLLLSNALFVEAFILYNHTHGREMLDIFVHQLLVLAVFVAALIGFLEFFVRNNVIVELLQMTFILLQGSWFWQIAFVLYPPSGGPAWDSMDHDNIMFLSTCFCWHYTLHIVIVGVIYAFVTWLVKSRLKRFCSSEVGLLKNTEREQESEEEM